MKTYWLRILYVLVCLAIMFGVFLALLSLFGVEVNR